MNHDPCTLSNEQWLDNFHRYLQRRFPGRSTAIHYSSDLKCFCLHCPKPLPTVEKSDIDAFLDGQLKQGLAPSTLKRRAAALKTFFAFLGERLGRTSEQNPVSTPRHSIRQPKLLPRDLKNHEVQQLMACVSDLRDQALFSLMLYGGLRVGELTLLTPSCFDSSGGAEDSVKLRVFGKGQKERVVYLLRRAFLPVQLYLQHNPIRSPNDVIFRNHRGKPLTVAGIQYLVRDYSEKSGVSFTAHDLRHTCARWLAEGRMPLLSLSRFLGHSNPQTTQRYIDGADPKMREDYDRAFVVMNSSPNVDDSTSPSPESSDSSISFEATSEPTLVREVPESFVSSPSLERLPTWMQQDCLDWIQQRWFGWKPSRRKVNALNVMRKLSQFLRRWSDTRTVNSWEELKESDVSAYVDHSLTRGLAANTIKVALDVIFHFLRYLKKKGRLSCVPERPRLELPAPLPQHLSPQELYRLEQVIAEEREKEDGDKLLVALYHLLTHGGLRLCEVLDLEFQALELEARKVRINEGKGRRDRIVYLTETGCDVLREYLAENPRVEGDIVLGVNGKAISRDQIWKRLKNLADAAGIDRLYPQRLRHTYATTLVNNGMSIEVLRKLMGHENINTTLIYAHLANQTIEHQYQQAMQTIEIKDVTTEVE